MSALDFAPQQSSSDALVAGGLDVNDAVGSRAFGDAELERHARKVRLGHHLDEALRRQFEGATLELILDEARSLLEEMADDWGGPTGLLEGVGWDEERHPRWPSGTPGGLGGQFMRVGQRFSLDGVQYDVAHVIPGGIIAHVATHGTKGTPKTVEFSSKELAADFKPEELSAAGLKAGQKVHVLVKAERPTAEPIKGAKQHTEGASFTGTVIDPYVDASTHDPSIAVPEGSDLKPEEWKRFGRTDQLVYSQVMERFGPWKADGAQKLCDSLKAKCDTSTKALLKSAYSSQFGSSTGFTLSLHSIFSHLQSMAKGGQEVEAARTQFESARYWQAEAANALRWDLYNRVRSPDVSLFHGTGEPSLFTNDIIKGGKPVFSGLSQSQKYRPGFFGSARLCSPIAIRHVVLATTSAEMYSASGGFKGEQEVCVADAFRADQHSMMIPDSGPGTGVASGGYTHAGPSGLQKKWLEGVTQHGIGGWALQVFRDSYKDSGANLPVPPEPAYVQMDKSGGKQWVEPPQDAKAFAYVDGAKKPVTELEYAITDEKGKPKSMQVKQMVEQGLLKPGDYIEGMQGTRYLIVEDKSDQYLGLAYYKITDLGTKVAGTETKNADTGQTTTAYAGHTLVHGSDVYGFEGGGTKAFKLLKGHYDLPTLSETKGTNFNPSAWVEDAPKNAVFVKDLTDGDKFKVGASFYEVGENLGNGNRRIKNLEDGELGQINGTYKTPKLLLKSGYTEAGVAELNLDDFFKGSPTNIGAAFETMQPGDVMQVGKTAYTVIEKTQDSKISAADQEGKLKLLDGTTEFTPLMAKPPGWSEPKVGDTLAIDGDKATLTKIHADGTLQFKKSKGGVVKMKVNDPRLLGIFHGDDYTIGTSKTKLKDLAPGTLIHGGTGEKIKPYMVVKQDGKQTLLRNLHTGEEMSVGSLKSYALLVAKHQPSAPAPIENHATPSSPASTFNIEAYEAGPEKGAQELEPGEKFTTNGKPFEVVSNASGTGGLLVYKNLDTGVVAQTAATANFAMQTLVPKGEGIAAHATSTPSTEPGEWNAQEWVAGPHVVKADPSSTSLEPGTVIESDSGTGVYRILGTKQSASGKTIYEVEVIQSDVKEPGVKFGFNTGAQVWVLTPKDAAEVNPYQAPATVAATKFDPSAYVESTAPSPEDLYVGDIVQASHGTYFQVTDKTETGLALKNLGNGKSTSVKFDYQGFHKLLTPKTKAHTPYDELKPTDPVDLMELKPGDQFTYPTGSFTVHQVVSNGDPQSDEPGLKIAPVSPGGHLGDPYAVSSSVVNFHAHADDTLPPQDTGAMSTVLPKVGDLPHASEGGFVPFKWHKGGHGTVYTKLQELAPDAVFVDKNEKPWKVVQSGPVPIVSDADGKLYAANGIERGRWLKYGDSPAHDAILDKMKGIAPTVSTSLPQTEAIVAAQHLQKQVPGEALTIKELNLGIGDVVKLSHNGDVFKITSFDGDHVALYEPASGHTQSVLSSYPPESYKKSLAPEGMFSEPIVEVGPTPHPPAGISGDLEDYEPTGATEQPQNMAPGTIYLGVSPNPAEAHLMYVAASDPEKLVIFDLTSGDSPVTLPKSIYGTSNPALQMMKLKAPVAAKGLLSPSESYPNASANAGNFELGILKPGTEFTHVEGPGTVFKVVKHGGKATTAEVVATPPGSTYAVGDPVNLKSSLIPSTFGPAGSHEQSVAAETSQPFSGDAFDYETEGGAFLSQLSPGDFFKTATGKVFKVTAPTDGNTTSIVDGFGEVTPAVSTKLAVTKLTPLPGATGNIVTLTDPEPPESEGEVKPGIAHSMFMDSVSPESLKVGDMFATGSGAYKLLEPLVESGASYYSKLAAKALVLKGPKTGQIAKINLQKTSLVKPLLQGMPLWKPSEFAKVIKPGNKTGKTVKIISILQTDNGIAYLVRQADGKADQVPETWLQSLKGNPTWKTVQTLATATAQADEISPGTVVKQVGHYANNLYVAGEYDGSHLELTPLGGGGAVKWSGSLKVETVMSAEEAAKMMRATAKAQESGHVSVNAPAMPASPKLPSNDDGEILNVLNVGDLFELPDGSTWKLLTKASWAGEDVEAELYDPGSTYSAEQGWKSGAHKQFAAQLVPVGVDPVNPSGLDPEYAADAQALVDEDPIPGLHPGQWVENVPAQTGTSGATIDNMPEGTQFEFDGVAYEVLPWTDQSEDDPATHVRALNGPLAGNTTTFGQNYKPSLVKFAPGADIGKPNWTPSGDDEVEHWTENDGEKTFLELGLGVGDKVDTWDGSATVTDVYGDPGTEGHVYDTQNDKTGAKSTFGVQGKPKAYVKLTPPASSPIADAMANLAATLHDATSEKTVEAHTLDVGDHFAIDAVPYVVLSKSGGGLVHAQPMTQAGGPTLQEIGAWTPVKKLDGDMMKKSLSSLPDGTKFTTGPVDGVAGGQVWTLTTKPPGAAKVDGAVWAQSSSGAYEWFHKSLSVTPLPPTASAAPLYTEQVPIGHTVTSSTVQVGDHYETPNGNVFHVVGKEESTEGGLTLSVQQMGSSDSTSVFTISPPADTALGARVEAPVEEPKETWAKGDVWKSPSSVKYEITSVKSNGDVFGKQMFDDYATGNYGAVTKLSMDGGEKVEPVTTEDYDPLVPYKWHKGGHGQVYVQLKTLAAGATFKDKAGKTYTVAKTESEGAAKGYVHYTDTAGSEFVTLSKNRVHAL